MKKSYINKVSVKQAAELKKRAELKAELLRENGAVCLTCGVSPSFPPISLSHIIPLSRGGKTDRANCILECGTCHSKYEKNPETRPPGSIGYKMWVALKEG